MLLVKQKYISTGIIIVVVVGCLAGVSLVLHIRRQRRTSVVLQERRETVHRNLVEAFSSHQLDNDGSSRFGTSHSRSYNRHTPATVHEDDDSEEDRPIIFRTERDPT